MKSKIIWLFTSGIVVLTLMVGCGGVSQEDYDSAVALRNAAQEQLTLLQNQLNTLQNNLNTAECSLDSTQEDIDDAIAEIAFLETLSAEIEEATVEAEQPAVYTNSDYGFSLEYPKEWGEKTDDSALGVTWRFGAGTYRIPSVRLIVLDESEGANLEEAFTAVLESDNKTLDSCTASNVNINGTDFTQAEVSYTGASGGYDSLIIGLVRNGKWIIIESYTISLFPYPYEGLQKEIINSVTFE